jgi:peptidoglycan/LPS O-acetylase OafA/YrhL
MKRRLNITKLSVLLIFISLGAELLVMKWDQDAAFYMLPFRFYELMVGALLASIGKNGSSDTFLGYRLRPRQRDIVSVVALASLLASFFLTDKQTFPGLWPLLPVFSTALLIGVGPFSVVNRFILSFRPMVFCGLISYPLYLWHWPLLSIPFIVEGGAPNWRLRASLVAAAVLMSILTFYFLERSFQRLWRNLDQSDSIRKLRKISGMGIISFISVGSLIWIFNGFSYRDQAVQQTINNGDVGQQSFHEYMARYKACLPVLSHFILNARPSYFAR